MRGGANHIWKSKITATAALVGRRAVGLDGATATLAGGVIAGFAEFDAATGEAVSVVKLGTLEVDVDDGSAALAEGDHVTLHATNGKVTLAAAGDAFYGVVAEGNSTTGGTGETVEIDLLSCAPIRPLAAAEA